MALDIDDGWHLYGVNPGVDFVVPTAVSVKAGQSLTIGDIDTPQAQQKSDPVLSQVLATYEGRIWYLVPLTVKADVALKPVTVEVIVKTQACDATRCLQPRTDTLKLAVVVASDADTTGRHPTVFEPLKSQSPSKSKAP